MGRRASCPWSIVTTLHRKWCSDARSCFLSSLILMTLLIVIVISLVSLRPEAFELLFFGESRYLGRRPVLYRLEEERVGKFFYRPNRDTQRRHIESARFWIDVMEAALLGEDISGDATSIDERYYRDCRSDTDFLRMYADPMCTMLWLKKLSHDRVVRIEDLLAVITQYEVDHGQTGEKKTQNGGFRTFFADGITEGYWKPCYGTGATSESFAGEVMGAILDKLGAFYRTSAVTAVYFNKTRMYELADDLERTTTRDTNARWKMDTILKYCDDSHGTGAEGAMVGWSTFPVKQLKHALKEEYAVDFRKLGRRQVKELQEGKFALTPESSFEDIRFVYENVAAYVVNLIGGYMAKFDHNIYMMTSRDKSTAGPFIYIDNDRDSWKRATTMHKWHIMKDGAFCTLCKFPKRVMDRLLTLRSPENIQKGITLGNLMKEAADRLYPHLPNGKLFGASNATWVDANVDWVIECFDTCVHRHGADQVLVDDPFYVEGKYEFYQQWARLERERFGGIH